MKNRWEKRRLLQELLEEETGCCIQHTGWPCNTCFHSMQFEGIDNNQLHKFWEATLLLRGDYRVDQYDLYRPEAQFDSEIDMLIHHLQRSLGKETYHEISA
jgi:hypothetical protein